MGSPYPGHVGVLASPNTRLIQNQPTSTADAASEEVGEADEPPDDQYLTMATPKTSKPAGQPFQKAAFAIPKHTSLLTQFLHTSESSSNSEDDVDCLSEAHRTQSSASTYSRGSATSMGELTSDGGHTSPRTSTPSPRLAHLKFARTPAVFNKDPFAAPASSRINSTDEIAPKAQPLPPIESEKKVEAGLGRKRCIMFACPSKLVAKEKTLEQNATAAAEKPVEVVAKRPSVLKFICPTRREDPSSVPRRPSRMTSPPPPVRRSQTSPSQSRPHRGSDATVKNNSPKLTRKAFIAHHTRRGSGASDMSHTEATRFHEFASSEEEVDDWTKFQGCYQRRLTVDDTLEKELGLRKLAEEVDEEDEIEEDDEELDLDDDEELKQSVYSGYDTDDGFHTDDEEGFARSDDDEDEDSDNDWWTPGRGRGPNYDQFEHIHPGSKARRTASHDSSDSESSIRRIGVSIPSHSQVRRQRSHQLRDSNHLELPDSTDFVCGTLDEDKPLEQAFLTHLEQRRAAKHRIIPQDIDPTFPTSDPEIDDEEDEVSEHDEAMESDHPMFHGQMDLHESDDQRRHPRWVIPKKRSPLASPKRLRSPPPAKRVSIHRSPPPHATIKRARSPAPFRPPLIRMSSSVPRNEPYKIAGRFPPHGPDHSMSTVDDDNDNTPRFNRGAVDIVMGLEKKRERRREKLYEKHCRIKAQHKHKGKKPPPGKGVEKMRDLGIGLNAYRGKKATKVAEQVAGGGAVEDVVHMLSY